MSSPAAPELLGALGRGAAFSAAAKLLQVVIALATIAVVGRLVGPEGFGLFAMALLVVALGDILMGGGLTESLVQRQDVTDGHEAASFWCVLLLGLAIAAAVLAARAPIAALFGEPLLAPMLAALAALTPITALGAVPLARLQRQLRFRAIAAIDSASAILSGALCVGLVLLGFGVWGLVVGELARAALRNAGFLWVARWRPKGLGRLSHLRELARFNAGASGARALGVVDKMLPRALIALLLGSEALGFYVIAWRLLDQVNAVLLQPLNMLALPLAARAQSDPAALRALLARAIGLTSALGFPVYLGMAALSPVLVPLILGPAWVEAIPVVQILLLLGLRSAMATFNNGLLRGLGRPELQVFSMAIGVGLILVLVPLAAPFGIVAVTIAVAVRRYATWPITARQVARLTGFAWGDQLRAAGRTLLAAGLMAAAVWTFVWAARASLSAPVLLAAAVALGLALYPLLLALVDPASLRELRARLAQAGGRLRARLGQPARATPGGG